MWGPAPQACYRSHCFQDKSDSQPVTLPNFTNPIDKVLTFISVFLLLSKNWIGCFLTNCKNSHFHRLINPHIHRFNIKEGCEQLHSLNFTTNNLQSVGSLLKGDWQDSNLRWTNVIRATIWWNRPLSYKHHIIYIISRGIKTWTLIYDFGDRYSNQLNYTPMY